MKKQNKKKEGLYLYCIREKTENASAFSTKGIDGEGEVFVLLNNDLEAVVSKVPLDVFGSEAVQSKAQEDLGWVKEKAVSHEQVIEEAMKENDKILSVIPMRFGTIFRDEERLKETINKDYSKIKKVLERIKGKQEWGVKVYLKDKKTFEGIIKEKNETIRDKEKELADFPEGMAFFMEEELKEAISKEADRELNNIVDDIFERLTKQSVDSIKNNILEKELTGKSEPMILNLAYLIPEEKVEDFKKDAESLNQEIQAKGFYLERSGPWPAYNFTSY